MHNPINNYNEIPESSIYFQWEFKSGWLFDFALNTLRPHPLVCRHCLSFPPWCIRRSSRKGKRQLFSAHRHAKQKQRHSRAPLPLSLFAQPLSLLSRTSWAPSLPRCFCCDVRPPCIKSSVISLCIIPVITAILSVSTFVSWNLPLSHNVCWSVGWDVMISGAVQRGCAVTWPGSHVSSSEGCSCQQGRELLNDTPKYNVTRIFTTFPLTIIMSAPSTTISK